jgi:pimeloyl-ACP methyl ester carboxylesterase
MSSDKSTTVRFISGLSRALPWAGDALLGELFLAAPPRMRSRPAESEVLGMARRGAVTTDVGTVKTWEWGAGPRVLLVHGHGGGASQMTSLVAPLVASGRTVVAYDAPGHGLSSGRHSSLVMMGRALAGVAAAMGPFDAVIAHSLGGAAVCLAAGYGARFERAVLIAPPSDMRQWFDRFVAMFSLDAEQATRLLDVVERRVSVPMSELRADSLGPKLHAETLVIHDRADKEVSFGSGEAVARSIDGAQLMPTHGLGHRRILADAGVIEAAVVFAVPDAPRPIRVVSLQREIEDELFHPEARALVAA